MSSLLSILRNKIRLIITRTSLMNIKILQIYSNSVQNTSHQTTEAEIRDILQKKFPNAKSLVVKDVSGGCGAMFNIYIESIDFKGLSIPKQHRNVYEVLQEQIKNIHGLHLQTKVPQNN